MKIERKNAEALVELNITIKHNDAVALGLAFTPFVEFLKKADEYNNWRKMPHDERNKIDENGNYVHPRPEGATMEDDDLEKHMRKIMKFINKIAIYPDESNIFD